MLTVRRSEERGRTQFGWLDSRHTFSFGDYEDPEHEGFRTLRVINEDVVAGGGGFPTHPHRDMEIFSYVLEGRLQHKDSLGNGRVLEPGQVQLMSAGRGVAHSEFNPDRERRVHFLQVWIVPREHGLAPAYTEWKPGPAQAEASKVLVISADGREASAAIRQDADVWRLRLKAGEAATHTLRAGRGAWIQVLSGSVEFAGASLAAGDGASTDVAGVIQVRSKDGAEALLFDLA